MVKYAKRKRSTKKTVYKNAKAVIKASKKLALRSVETKWVNTAPNQVLATGSIYSVSPTQLLTYGNTANTRVGDDILLQSLTLSGHFQCAAAILNVKVRIIVGWSDLDTANTTFATGIIGTTDLFYTGGTNITDRVIHPSLMTVLYDEIMDVNSNTSTGRDYKSFYTVIGLGMKKFKYKPATGLGKAKNLFLCVLSDNPTAAGNNGVVQMSCLLKFKDP